ncbi:MAG: helix-turn-helix transcriptional regulator [Terriglobales bacterium]
MKWQVVKLGLRIRGAMPDQSSFPLRYTAKVIEDAEMLADVKAYDAAKARLEDGEDELIPLEITERRLSGEPALRIWREHRKLTQEQLAKKAKVSRALIAAIETDRKTGSVSTWKKLGAALDVRAFLPMVYSSDGESSRT